MRIEDIITELKTFYKDDIAYRDLERHLDGTDVDRWTTALECSRQQLFDGVAIRLA
jgi:hypothetical protein